METKFPSTKKEFNSLTPEQQKEVVENLEKYFVGKEIDEESDLHERMLKVKSFLPKKNADKIGNKTCQRNRRAIMVFIEKFSSENTMMPSVTEISLGTGLSRTTIYDHIKSMRNGNHLKEEQEVFDAQIGRFRSIVLNQAMEGNLQAIKLFKELSTLTAQTTDAVSEEKPAVKSDDNLKAA